jgi:integrase
MSKLVRLQRRCRSRVSDPGKGHLAVHPMPIVAEPWPGIPVRGRNAAGRADVCWVPIARGLTPHGLRHTRKTLMEELRTLAKLMDERMGHADGSVQAATSSPQRCGGSSSTG